MKKKEVRQKEWTRWALVHWMTGEFPPLGYGGHSLYKSRREARLMATPICQVVKVKITRMR